MSAILIVPCLFLFSACADSKKLSGVAFYSGENKLEDSATFSYNFGEEISILGSDLSVRASYTNNTTVVLSASDFSYKVFYSATNSFDNVEPIQNLPNSSSSAGNYKIVVSFNGCSALLYISIAKPVVDPDPNPDPTPTPDPEPEPEPNPDPDPGPIIEPKYFVNISKIGGGTIYFGDSRSTLDFSLTTDIETTNSVNAATYYVVDENTFNSIPSSIENKAKYILETSGINYVAASEIGLLNVGNYYVFATIEIDNQNTIYSTITSSSKFTISAMPISVKTVPSCSYVFSHLDYKEFVSLSELNNNIIGGELEDVYGNSIDATLVGATFEFKNANNKIDCESSTAFTANFSIAANKTNYCVSSSSIEISITPVLHKGLIPVAEPVFNKASFNGKEHEITINNFGYYCLVSGNLKGTNVGSYTAVIKPKFIKNYNIDWGLSKFAESEYTYYKGFETFEIDAVKGGITNVSVNKENGQISISWEIEKAERSERICLGEFFDLRVGGEINTSIIPYSFNESYVYYRVALYSETNKNMFLNSYANNNFTISLLDNNFNIMLIADSTENESSTEIIVDVTNQIYIAVPLENFDDGINISYKIIVAETESQKQGEFDGTLTLNKISANFTNSSTLAVSAGTTLQDITNMLFKRGGVSFTWNTVEISGGNNGNGTYVDLSTSITENISYQLFLDVDYESIEYEEYGDILELIVNYGSYVFNFEVYAQDSAIENLQEYSYQNNGNVYRLKKFGNNIVYLSSDASENYYFKFVESSFNSAIGFYEVYSADAEGIATKNKLGIYTQGQLSGFVNAFLAEVNKNY